MTYAKWDGAEVIYSLRNSDNLANKIANELSKTGQNIWKVYQRKLPSNPSQDYYYILRDTPNNESLIIEYGFADSNGDDVELIKNHYEELAEAVVKAVADYLGVAYFWILIVIILILFKEGIVYGKLLSNFRLILFKKII